MYVLACQNPVNVMLGYNYGAGASDFCCHIVLLSDFRKVIFFHCNSFHHASQLLDPVCANGLYFTTHFKSRIVGLSLAVITKCCQQTTPASSCAQNHQTPFL